MTGDTSFTMPVAPTGMSNNGGFGGWGGDGAWWIIILFLFCFNGGWGNGFGNGGMNGGVGSEIQRGFDHSATVTKLDGITQGICDSTYALNNAITNGFHGVDSAICNLGYQTQNGFNQTNVALMQGQNALASQLANCCCETREAIQGVNYNLATQSCDTRNVIQNTTRDIIDNANANSRAILDFLTQDKISSLQAENQSLKLAASQANQNAVLQAAMTANTAEILNRTAPIPRPAYNVPNPYTGQYGYGCGCNTCGACA